MRLCKCFAVCLLSVLFSAPSVLPATLCTQDFNVEGKTSGDSSVLVISEKMGGECSPNVYSTVITFLGMNRYKVEYKIEYMQRDDSAWVPPSFETDVMEPYRVLKDSGGVYYLGSSMAMRLPEHDSLFDAYWISLGGNYRMPYSSLDQWCGDIVDEPVFLNVTVDLVYRSTRGLYKNYTIDKAVYFPESKCLVVIINQPRSVVGWDTLHGFLVYSHR